MKNRAAAMLLFAVVRSECPMLMTTLDAKNISLDYYRHLYLLCVSFFLLDLKSLQLL